MKVIAPRRRLWPVVAGCSAAGILLGASLILVAPALFRGADEAPALPSTEEHIGGSGPTDTPKITGDLFTTLKGFTVDDPEGNTVLTVSEIGAFTNLDSLGNSDVVRVPRGHVRDVNLLLRRGPSGRVSLSEAFRGNSKPHEPELKRGGMRLQIGPLEVSNVKLRVAMGASTVIIQIDRAIVRVQRKITDLAPRIFLSEVHGNMVSPDPLPQPIAIEGGEGVVDLASDPFLDIRTRVCIGDSEMRMRILMPERKQQMQMTVDANGPLAKSALVALNLVSIFKSDKMYVESGQVAVAEPFDCTRAKGRTRRADMKAVIHPQAGPPSKVPPKRARSGGGAATP